MPTATTITDDLLESSLNALYAKQFTEKQAISKFAYLCDRQKNLNIAAHHRNRRLGTLLRKLDLAAFITIKNAQ